MLIYCNNHFYSLLTVCRMVLSIELEKLNDSRNTFLKCAKKLTRISNAVSGNCIKCRPSMKGNLCIHCKAEESEVKEYEHRLFSSRRVSKKDHVESLGNIDGHEILEMNIVGRVCITVK